MERFYFYYYFQFGMVACAKARTVNGFPVGGELNAIPNNIHEITESAYYNCSLFDLKGSFEYKDTEDGK